ncbi:MAG: hypothetical protein AB7L09_00380 [Nitrospira sp.]
MSDDVGVQPNRPFLEQLSTGPDSHIDARLRQHISQLVDKSTDEVKVGLHQALDYGARYALCSDFIMRVMSLEWERLGGSSSDPTPWRDELEWRGM